jgi:hypothetical protein
MIRPGATACAMSSAHKSGPVVGSPEVTKTRERPSGDRADCSDASVAGVVISRRISGAGGGDVSRR